MPAASRPLTAVSKVKACERRVAETRVESSSMSPMQPLRELASMMTFCVS